MNRTRRWGLMAIFAVTAALAPFSHSQQPIKIKIGAAPKPEPVAETKLLMAGIANPNFNGLGKILKDAPKEVDAWAFARGQALLIGETANLLMLRSPKNNREAQDVWLTRAADMRDAAGKVAIATAGQDFLKSRAALVDLANACNRCHQSFRVAARVAPFPDEP